MEKITVIVQARCGSTRFPGKILKKINNTSLIEIIFKRLKKSKKINDFILATTTQKIDDSIEKIFFKTSIKVFRGSKNNVLSRYYEAAKKNKSEIIIRITGDCPLADPNIIDKMISILQKKKLDYISNTITYSYPDGLDVEVFTFKALEKCWKNSKTAYEKEHVTPYLKNEKLFKVFNLQYKEDLSKVRLSVDEPEDLVVINKIFKNFEKNIYFSSKQVINFINKNKSIMKINKKFKNNEGSALSIGTKMWRRANRVIPGGNMLLSKRPELFLPNYWPTYYVKSKDCFIWDLENKRYIDFSFMGVGTNILGYNNIQVNKAVTDAIKKGNLTTLNNPDEIKLAEKLISMHPWSEMVKFARTGAEANSIAIRLARAKTQKEIVLVCGYHGWHDWYLANNIDSKSLDKHLLSGLKTEGVSKSLRRTTVSFAYNDLESFKKIIKKNNNKIACVIMEVSRNHKPQNNFIQQIRKLTRKNNIILIFDECTSGFRGTFGGLHKIYKVYPDMATFGKALGNGYAITALLGKRSIMKEAKNTFISSTFWTEKIGVSAALKTLEIMEKKKSWVKIEIIGKKIKKKWIEISKKYDVKINVNGLDAMPSFMFEHKDHQALKTFFTQEMLKKKILATNVVYVSTTHTVKLLKIYFDNFDKIFKRISIIVKNKKYKVKNFLDGPISSSTFKRLN